MPIFDREKFAIMPINQWSILSLLDVKNIFKKIKKSKCPIYHSMIDTVCCFGLSLFIIKE